MKKILSFFIASAIAFSFSSCGEEECDHGVYADFSGELVGTWYEEAENEEISYSATGTFYDKFSNLLRCAETNGRYELDMENKKLTEYYTFMGQNDVSDFKLYELSPFSFTMFSKYVGEHKYERVVTILNLKVGESQSITIPAEYSCSPYSYQSTNSCIASVSSDGTVKAEGEKGTAYIKMETSYGTVWARVVVEANFADLWFPYSNIIGMSYKEMSDSLKVLGEPYSGEDGYSFGYRMLFHDVVDQTNVFLDSQKDKVTEIQLEIKKSVPEASIISYMSSRYFKFAENSDYIFYTTCKDKEKSVAMVAYDKKQKKVIFIDAEVFFYPQLWNDFTPLFGTGKAAIENAMDSYGYPFLMSDFGYSDNGSDYYKIQDNNNADMVGFVYNPDNLVSEYWIYMKAHIDYQTVFDYLVHQYIIEDSEETDYSFVFYNSNKSLRVVLDIKNGAVVYTDLTKKQHTHTVSILGNFHKALGLNRYDIISQLGNPYMEEDNTMYYIGNEYVSVAAININESTKKCNSIVMMIYENVSSSTIIDFCNSQFTVFDKGTAEDGSQYAWTDGSSMAESKYGILYVPEKRYVSYTLLGGATQGASANMEKIIEDVKKMRVIKKGIQKHCQQKIQKISGLFK